MRWCYLSLLNTLKETTYVADEAGDREYLVKKSRIVLEEKSATIAEFMKSNKPSRARQDVSRKIADSRWNTFRETRNEIVELYWKKLYSDRESRKRKILKIKYWIKR